MLVGGSFTSDAVLMGLSGMQLEDMNAATVDDNAADIFAFTTSDFGTSMVGTVIADFNHGEDKLAFSADGGTSWSNTPLASGELVANSDNLGTGETWIFSGTELAGIDPGLVLFKIMDDPPSCFTAISKDILVLVDGFSKIITMDLPAKGLSSSAADLL